MVLFCVCVGGSQKSILAVSKQSKKAATPENIIRNLFFDPSFCFCFNLLLMKDGLFVSSAAYSVQYPVALAAC